MYDAGDKDPNRKACDCCKMLQKGLDARGKGQDSGQPMSRAICPAPA